MSSKKKSQANGRRKGARKQQQNPKQLGYIRPPPIVPTLSKRHTFRYRNGGTATVSVFDSLEMLTMLTCTLSTSSLLGTGIIKSYRIHKVTIYFAVQGGVSGSGFVNSPTLSWEAGSGALTEEGKVSSKAGVISYQDVGGMMSITPPANSTQGFWYNDTSVGDIFTVNVPSGVGTVLDIDMEFTLCDEANPGYPQTYATNAIVVGLVQRNKANWSPVGYPAATY
jgi:hypothetical protein